MSIYDLISAVPNVIWSGVIASALTLSGVLIVDRSSTKRLRLQLKHDAEEKTRERKAAIRREVYLHTAEELVKASQHLMSLPQTDLSKTDPAQELQGFFAAAAELQLVSEPKTAFLTGQLVTKYGELLLKVLERLMPIQSLRTEIAIRDEHYNRTQSELSRILAAMTQYNESAQSDPRVFEALSRSFEFQQGQATKFSTERDELWSQRNALHLEFVKYLISELRQLGPHQVEVMVQLRRELELEGDVAEFSRQMEMQWERMSVQLDEFLKKISGMGTTIS